MSITELKTFVHPKKAYELEFPAHWEHRVQDDGRACGFGPYERDNVGLWISVMPASIDSDRLAEEMPRMFEETMFKANAENVRPDPTLHDHAWKADIKGDDEGGHYWIIAGGDLILFASTQVPVDERETWNPIFDQVMTSLEITRENEHLMRKVADEVMTRLREVRPEQEYEFDEKGIRGRDHAVYLDNVFREVRLAPERRQEIIEQFVQGIVSSADALAVEDDWDAVAARVLPVLKPVEYIKGEGPTKSLHTADWLPGVVICYVINAEKSFRFITGWDLDRWSVSEERLHDTAIENLGRLPWPERLEGARQPSGGRVILICTDDSFTASRLLHPDFHRLLSGPLGSPFLAGVPDRNTLVAFTNRKGLKRRVGRQVQKDHDSSAYPITPGLFLVTPDGVAPA